MEEEHTSTALGVPKSSSSGFTKTLLRIILFQHTQCSKLKAFLFFRAKLILLGFVLGFSFQVGVDFMVSFDGNFVSSVFFFSPDHLHIACLSSEN